VGALEQSGYHHDPDLVTMSTTEHDYMFQSLGTTVRLLVSTTMPSALAPGLIASPIQRRLAEIHLALTRFEPASELNLLNAHGGEWVRVSDDLFRESRPRCTPPSSRRGAHPRQRQADSRRLRASRFRTFRCRPPHRVMTGDPLHQAFWFASRAFGISAMILLAISVAMGLAMSGRRMRRPGLSPKLRHLHESATLVTLALIVAHAGLLLLDTYLRPGLVGITVPQPQGPRCSTRQRVTGGQSRRCGRRSRASDATAGGSFA
jgi:hypothetical protein